MESTNSNVTRLDEIKVRYNDAAQWSDVWWLIEQLEAAQKELEAERRIDDFMDYFRPHGGVIDVLLGPFERAKEPTK